MEKCHSGTTLGQLILGCLIYVGENVYMNIKSYLYAYVHTYVYMHVDLHTLGYTFTYVHTYIYGMVGKPGLMVLNKPVWLDLD